MVRAVVLCLGLLLALPSAAGAHAVLVETTPARGAALQRAPEGVDFRFTEPVESNFGAVRVFDSSGRRVDRGGVERPGGDAEAVGVRLAPGLPEGSYTATYRVVSADAHPVSGGFVFSVGEDAGRAVAVADLVGGQGTGPVTATVFGIARALSYLAIALAVGGVLFVALVWLPALRELAGAGPDWLAASEAFAARLRTLALAALLIGLTGTALGLVLQGATAAGTSFWEALDPAVVGEVLGTRFGTVWGLRLLDWALLGALGLFAAARAAAPALRPASLGATGLAAGRLGHPAAVAFLGLLLAFLVISPALAGHAGAADPRAVLVGADAIHVLAMSTWVGGLIILVAALPAATRRLEARQRTRLLAESLRRFSPLALASVIALLATGIVQSVLHLESLSDLWATAFGRAILVKAGLMLLLIGLGALNRRRSIPRLRRIAAGGGSPGREGLLLRRTLRGELVLFAGVLAATAALTSYAPPDTLAGGPFSATRDLGPARLELTVDPARVGANEVHLYLFNRRTGAQYDRARRVAVELRLPERRIGPLEVRTDKAGPGHWVARRAAIAPQGDWTLTVAADVSDFEQYRAQVEVPVR